tara:strand:+ start:3146 stop:3331 length:186 start_codon:yes stop_codon:yes gene_type:complete
MKGLKRTVVGLLLIILGLYTFTYEFFREELLNLIKLIVGNIGLFLLLIGLIIFLFGISEMH